MTTKNSHHWELSPLVRVQTVKKPRRAREGRSPFDRAVPGSTCCRFSIRKAVQIYNVGTGRFLRRKISFSREKIVSLQAPRPKNLRFLAETGEGGRKAENPLGFQVSPLAKLPTAQIVDLRRGTWPGSLLPRPPACQNFFDKLSSPFRGSRTADPGDGISAQKDPPPESESGP